MSVTREQLIDLCERGVVPMEHWSDRDSSRAQRQLGECLALLRAGCPFQVVDASHKCWWVLINFYGFDSFEYGRDEVLMESGRYYVPMAELLREDGGDWY